MDDAVSPDGGTDEDMPQSDEEEIEAEWHVWLVTTLLVAGGVLLLAPDDILPGLVRGVGPILVFVGVAAFLGQWAYKRWA